MMSSSTRLNKVNHLLPLLTSLLASKKKLLKLHKENLSFQLIEHFKITDILGIYPKKQSKNIVTIEFISYNKSKSSIIADLITDADSKTLITKIKNNLKKNSL